MNKNYNNILKQIGKYIFLFLVGGFIYYWIEIVGRGYSHWTMFILGGICFISLGLINELFTWNMPMWLQMLIGCIIITLLEFITGCIVNLWLGWNVWDYSLKSFNLLGQICIQNSCYWFILSAVGIILDDYLRYWLFKECEPIYRWL